MTGLANAAVEYLALRHAFGHELRYVGSQLPKFVAFLEHNDEHTITINSALAWATQPDYSPGSSGPSRRMMVVRGFARHMAGIDPATEIPPPGLVPHRSQWRPPFVFSQTDLETQLESTAAAEPHPLAAATYRTLFALLAVTGMRISEAIHLNDDDLNPDAGMLLIRDSKFGKSRRLPLHPSTVTGLRDYRTRRDELLGRRPAHDGLFVAQKGGRLQYPIVRQKFRNACTTAGIGAGSTNRPRIHDLRH